MQYFIRFFSRIYSCRSYIQIYLLSIVGSLIIRSRLWVRIILIAWRERRILLSRLRLRVRCGIRRVITSGRWASVHRRIISVSLRERIGRCTGWSGWLSLNILHLLLSHLISLHSQLWISNSDCYIVRSMFIHSQTKLPVSIFREEYLARLHLSFYRFGLLYFTDTSIIFRPLNAIISLASVLRRSRLLLLLRLRLLLLLWLIRSSGTRCRCIGLILGITWNNWFRFNQCCTGKVSETYTSAKHFSYTKQNTKIVLPPCWLSCFPCFACCSIISASLCIPRDR